MLETLDILVDLIHNYGSKFGQILLNHFSSLAFAAILSDFHESLLTTLCSLLVDPNPLSVRKRAYIALCKCCVTMSLWYILIQCLPLLVHNVHACLCLSTYRDLCSVS